MKKTLILLSLLLLTSLYNVSAQNLKTILKKHYAAVGQTMINKTEAVVATGVVNQMGMELPFTLYQKRPAKVRFEANFQEMKLVQAFDGENGWSINPMSGTEPTDMGVSEKKAMQSMAEFEGRLYNWKKKGYKVSYEGNEESEGENLFKIKLETSGDEMEIYYINSGTYLISKVFTKTKMQGMDVEVTKMYSDYRDIEGYKVPFKTENIMMGQPAGELIINSFDFKKSGEISDDLFVKPEAE